MVERRNNYEIQVQQAKKLFLTYDQQVLIRRCNLSFDEVYIYTKLLALPYRIHRKTGDMERLQNGCWQDGNSFGEVMTILDWLCDSRDDRYSTGRWVNIATHGHYFHGTLQEDSCATEAAYFDKNPDAFRCACKALGGKEIPGGDLGYAIELIDGLKVALLLWHGDEEFPPRLRCLWDENATRYIRYETTWYAAGLIMQRLMEHI